MADKRMSEAARLYFENWDVLDGWYDANDTLLSVRPELDVVMDANQVFRVRFRKPVKLNVSGGGNAIQQAVASAHNGDTLVIGPGRYDEDPFSGKINRAQFYMRLQEETIHIQ